MIDSPAARGDNLAKRPPNQVIGDFRWGSSNILSVLKDGVQFGDRAILRCHSTEPTFTKPTVT